MLDRRNSSTEGVYARFADRWQQLKPGDGRLPAVVEPVVGQQWVSVAKAASSLVDSVSGVPLAEPAVALLAAVLGAEEVQTAMLKSIARDVSLIREGPFRSAQKYLEIAHAKGPGNPRYESQLDAAHDQLVQAWGQARSEQEKSVICYHLGLVGLLQNDTGGAVSQLRKSYEHCRIVVNSLVGAMESTKKNALENTLDALENRNISGAQAGAAVGVVVSAGGAFLLPLVIPVAGGMFIANRVRQSRRGKAATMLENYAPFVDAVVATLHAVAGDTSA